MTLREIRSQICELRGKIEDLGAAANEIYLADGTEAEEAASLEEFLDDIASMLATEEND